MNIVYLITFNPGPLLQPGEHDYGGAPLLPHHPPVVGQGLRQWPLQHTPYNIQDLGSGNKLMLSKQQKLY